MADKKTKTHKSIVGSIMFHIRSNSMNHRPYYSRWYVGITNNPKIREKQHLRTYSQMIFFRVFYARTKTIAHGIEVLFSLKGTKNASMIGGARSNSWYVYVFKADPTFLDYLKKFLSE